MYKLSKINIIGWEKEGFTAEENNFLSSLRLFNQVIHQIHTEEHLQIMQLCEQSSSENIFKDPYNYSKGKRKNFAAN